MSAELASMRAPLSDADYTNTITSSLPTSYENLHSAMVSAARIARVTLKPSKIILQLHEEYNCRIIRKAPAETAFLAKNQPFNTIQTWSRLKVSQLWEEGILESRLLEARGRKGETGTKDTRTELEREGKCGSHKWRNRGPYVYCWHCTGSKYIPYYLICSLHSRQWSYCPPWSQKRKLHWFRRNPTPPNWEYEWWSL